MNWLKKNFFSYKKKQFKNNKFDIILEKTKFNFFSKINRAILGKSKIDDDILNQIEETLISSDVGVPTTIKIINRLQKKILTDKYINVKEIYNILYDIIYNILSSYEFNNDIHTINTKINKPYIILVVGINGVGKTTTIGKISYYLKNKGLQLVIGAADTFRAAAINQLSIWANIANVPIIKKENADPAAVVFDTLSYAKSKNLDVVLIDTAGRLHNKIHLMNELSKIKRIIKKFTGNSINEVMLILDGSTGQNAFEQTKQFISYTDVNSITVTKLDGSAKGGIIIGICEQFNIPIKYIGIGEKIKDLQKFNKNIFIDSFFNINAIK